VTTHLRPWFRSVLAISVLGAASLAAFGCSSSEQATPPAGGSIWQMQGASCQDRTAHKLALTTTDESGHTVDRLLSDGADGARVRCQIDATHFSVTIANAAGSLTASGHITGSTSTDTKLTLSLPTGTYSNPSATPCLLNGITTANSTFVANFTCAELDNTANTADTCDISANGASVVSYWSFENCTGF
jgi:hypothetical protein